MRKLSAAALLFMVISLSGCFLLEQKTVILWTDIPEAAAYVEFYNASQTDFRVELVYAENPADFNLLTSDGAPDIVLSENLAANSVINAFEPLDKMIEEGRFSPDIIYPDLFELGKREEVLVLPVSFNIPAIMYKQDTLSSDITGLTITSEQLKIESQSFNELSTEKFRTLGFAPSWASDFLLYKAFLRGVDFSETEDGSLIWNDTKLQESIAFSRDWTENINSGFEAEEDFTLTYCYDPGYKLLNSGRIGFYYTDLRDFFAIPANDRTTLDFKWLGGESSIPVCEDIVYIGIPSKSKKKKTAEEFIIWFLNKDTQQQLLESSKFKRTRGFGICGGLSSVHTVNELIMPAFYTRLIGNMPPIDYFSFPSNLPAEWSSMRDDVIIPWLIDQSSAEPENGSLTEMLKTWTLQQKKK